MGGCKFVAWCKVVRSLMHLIIRLFSHCLQHITAESPLQAHISGLALSEASLLGTADYGFVFASKGYYDS